MSEKIEDSTEMSGILLHWAVCKKMRTVRVSYPHSLSRQEGNFENELLFSNNTCLIAALRAGMQRTSYTRDPQIEWGDREVSPSYRLCRLKYIE